MRTVSINYDVYKYQELSEQAKDEAKRWYLEGKDANWFKDDCDIWLSETFPNSKLEVQFSLSSCQGDGLNIYGNVDYNDIYAVIVESSAKFTEKEKKYIAWFIKEFASDYKMIENPRYGYCYSCMWNFTENIIEDMEYNNIRGIKYDVLKKFNEVVKEHFEKLCSDFERDGYSYFYEVDDDEMIDMCEANEWEFTADGKIF